MVMRICGVNLCLEIETGCCRAESHLGHIFFHSLLKLGDLSGGAAGTYYEHTRSQRIKSAGMTHLEFLYMEAALDGSPDGIKRSPAERFVYSDYFSRYKIHYVH